jgi:D-ribose pyranose/furanose isomerase RbsD
MAFITHSPDHIYFATDGSWGHAEGMIVLDTVLWTDKDWQRIDEALDDERVTVAWSIANEIGRQRSIEAARVAQEINSKRGQQ